MDKSEQKEIPRGSTSSDQRTLVDEDGTLTSKQVLSLLDACVECNACEGVCSVFQVTRFANPLTKIKILRKLAKGEETVKDERQALFTCTKCEGCQNACPARLPLIRLYDWGRNQVVSRFGFINPMQKGVIDNILQTGNPFHEEGSRFKQLLDLSDHARAQVTGLVRGNSKTLLHLGCMLSYRITQMATDLFDILAILGIDFTLDPNEACCGYYVWNCGDHHGADEFIKHNTEHLEEYEEIICACAGCYTFFRTNYPKTLRFTHVVERIAAALPAFLKGHPKAASQVRSENGCKLRILFHDSCHLARPWGIITPPRAILKELGHEVVEFSQNGENTLCCGADGGMRFVNKPLAIQIGRARLDEARSKAPSLSTLCPFCIFNFQEANASPETLAIESLYAEIQKDLRRILLIEGR
ncbi:MAG: (Fe-S)-binding protein [Candidatus Lokiarchaeota archaeon]|nr:(Fe-S)-binding protein [Candidatus Lokiarchaeota archaeon]